MAENLFLRLTAKTGFYNVEWMLLDETSGIVRFRGEGDLEELAEIVVDMTWAEAFVMLAGEEVLLTQATIPSKQSRQIMQAVPFMVEENLATDIEACHFAVGKRDSSGNVPVAVIETAKLENCLASLKEAGILADFLTADVLSVPYESGCSIMLDGERALIRNGPSQGFATETGLLATVVDLMADADKENLLFMVHESQREATGLIESQINAEQEVPVQNVELEYQGFEVLCREFNRDAINLLQGDFKVESASSGQGGNWRSVTMLAAFVFGLHISVLMGQAIYFDIEANAFEAQARSLYADIYPNDRNVRDIRRRWKAHLGQVNDQANDGFLALLAATAKHLPESKLTLNNANYNESRGDLVLQMDAPGSEQLIQFSETLKKLGLNAEIGTINQGDDSVKGSIKVRSRGGR